MDRCLEHGDVTACTSDVLVVEVSEGNPTPLALVVANPLIEEGRG